MRVKFLFQLQNFHKSSALCPFFLLINLASAKRILPKRYIEWSGTLTMPCRINYNKLSCFPGRQPGLRLDLARRAVDETTTPAILFLSPAASSSSYSTAFHPIQSGTPQAWVRGPLLYLLKTDDLTITAVNFRITFAGPTSNLLWRLRKLKLALDLWMTSCREQNRFTIDQSICARAYEREDTEIKL